MRDRPPIDPKRTGVKATLIEWTKTSMECSDGRWYGPPGGMIPREDNESGMNFHIVCPGCGSLGTPRDGAKWTVSGGNEADVTTLSYLPSILKNCCGWHGYLTNGVFVSC